jgi:hypothetical protein
MKKKSKASRAAAQAGIQSKKIFVWLWHSWVKAQREVPLLRWLALLALVVAGLVIGLASAQGETPLTMAVYGMIAFMFVVTLSAIVYLLSKVQRKQRLDSLLASKRLSNLIRKIARAELEANEKARLVRDTVSQLEAPPAPSDARPFIVRDGNQR